MMHRLCAGAAGVVCVAMLVTPSVTGDESAKPQAAGQVAWTLEEALAQLQLHPNDAYLQYVALQLARRQGNAHDVADQLDRMLGREAWRGRGRRGDVDLFSIFTGALAVQESLQLDTMRGRGSRNGQPDAAPRKVPVGENEEPADYDKRRRETVDVAGLTGPTIKGHPWVKMLGARKPEIDPLAKMVPDDFYFVQFRSVAKMMDVLEASDLWGTHLANQAYREARTLNVGERLKKQLAVETNPLLKPFYDLVAEEVAVTGSDLFVREGSDVTVIFRFKQPTVFRARMDGFLASAEKNHKDAKRTTGEYRGVKYDHIATPDRDVCVYSAYPADGIHVRSNSKLALQRVIEAIQGKTADGKPVVRLGNTPEFAYIRTIYPRGAKEEDGFVYLSDPFIRRLVGPTVKLTERRRMLCYNHLRMMGHGALMHQTEFGKPPASLDALYKAQCCPEPFRSTVPATDAKKIAQLIADLDSNQFATREKASEELTKLGRLAEEALRKQLAGKPPLEVAKRVEALLQKVEAQLGCPDGGIYTLSADGKHGVCSHHGHAQHLTPNLEIPVSRVQGDEADEYKQFLEEYNSYWRTFFDPIAIRIQVTPERYRLETIVLPLIDNSIYGGMALALGGKPENLDPLPVPKRNIFSVAMRFNKTDLLKNAGDFEKEIKRDLLRELGAKEEIGAKLNVTEFLEKGVGNQIGLHVYDSVPNFDLNLPEALGQLVGTFNGRARGRDIEELLVGFMLTGFNSPVYLSIPVQDAKIVDGFGDQVEALMALAARHRARGGFFDFATDFDQVPFKGDPQKMMRSFALKFGPIKLRYFFARIGNTVYVASKDFILEDLLAMEQNKANAVPQTAEGHAMIRLRPRNWHQVLADYRLGWAENHRQACLNNQGPLGSVARAYTGHLGKIDPKELAQLGDRVQRDADQLHQVHFFCPEGGRYVLGPDGKAMTCSVHGGALAPRQPAAPAENNALTKQLSSFTGLTATLTFMEEGLRAVVEIERK